MIVDLSYARKRATKISSYAHTFSGQLHEAAAIGLTPGRRRLHVAFTLHGIHGL